MPNSNMATYEIDGLGIVTTDPLRVMNSATAPATAAVSPLSLKLFSIGSNPFQPEDASPLPVLPDELDLEQPRFAPPTPPPPPPPPTTTTPPALCQQQRPRSHALDAHRRTATSAELAASKDQRAHDATIVWYQRFNQLIDCAIEHGTCNVPQKYKENPQLGFWVNKQRMEKMFLDEGKRSSMTPRRIECLESIGFTSTWAKRKGDYSWMRHFAEMQQYQAQHGHCNVSTKYDANPPLGRWVSTQRSEYKLFQRGMCTKLMNQTKIDMLNSLAFQWEIPLPEVALARRRAATLLEEQIFVHTFYTLLSRTTKSPPRPHTTA